MAETTSRPRQIEYYNPRPMILGMCFFWGVVMGFCLFYFSPPKQLMDAPPAPAPQPAPLPTSTPQDRRREGLPDLADVSVEAGPQKPGFETMDFPLPAIPLTTDGGITGRTALPPAPASQRPALPSIQSVPADPLQPPIPELMP